MRKHSFEFTLLDISIRNTHTHTHARTHARMHARTHTHTHKSALLSTSHMGPYGKRKSSLLSNTGECHTGVCRATLGVYRLPYWDQYVAFHTGSMSTTILGSVCCLPHWEYVDYHTGISMLPSTLGVCRLPYWDQYVAFHTGSMSPTILGSVCCLPHWEYVACHTGISMLPSTLGVCRLPYWDQYVAFHTGISMSPATLRVNVMPTTMGVNM